MNSCAILNPVSRTIARHLQTDYDTFRGNPDPFNLQDEMAQLRTLLVEVRESLDAGAVDLLLQFGELVKAHLRQYMVEDLELDVDEADQLAEVMSTKAVEAHASVYGMKARISTKEAVDIAKVVESLSKVAERYKKMSDGVVLRINYDNRVVEAMTKFVVQVVLRHVPLQHRRQIAASARAFLPNIQGAPDLLAEIIDG